MCDHFYNKQAQVAMKRFHFGCVKCGHSYTVDFTPEEGERYCVDGPPDPLGKYGPGGEPE